MLEILDSGKRIVKIPTKVELTSCSKPSGNLFEFKKSQYHVVTTSDANIRTILYRIYYTYDNETQCVLSQSVKAYPKDGRFYVLALTFKIFGTYTIEFSAGEEAKIQRVVQVVESEKVIKMRKAKEKKKLKEMKEKNLKEKNRKKKKEKEKKKKRCRPPRNRKQKNPRPLRRRSDPPTVRRNLTHIYQGFEAEETALLFCKSEMKRQLLLFCMDKPFNN